jgi:O-antigen/teichoic acid export membrane protein
MVLQRHIQRLIGDSENQGKSRIVKSSLTGVATLVVRGLTIATGLVTIPLTAQYLGVERYGMWLTLSSFLTWAGLVDFGLANSLTNVLATADGRQDRQKAQEAVSSAFWMLLALTFIIGLCGWIVFPWIPWHRILNVRSPAALAEVDAAVFVTLTLVLCRVLLSLPGQIYGAYQEGYLYQLWSILGSVASISALFVAIALKSSTAVLLTAFFGCAFLTDIGAALHLFGQHRQWLRPTFLNFKWSSSKTLLKAGGQLWIAQVSAIIIFQTDLIIIAQLFGATAVASYGTAAKLFSLVLMIQSAFITPLWPAYSESLARGDIAWITKTFKSSIYLSFAWATTIGLVIATFSPTIITAWIGSQTAPSTLTLLALFFRTVALAVDQCVSVLGNGLALLRLQAIIAPIFAVSNLALALLLGNTIGISGVAWATGICVCIFSFAIFSIKCRSSLRQLSHHME